MQKFIILWLVALLTLSACTRPTAENPPQTTPLPTMTPSSADTAVATATAAPAQPSTTAVVNLDTQTSLTPEGYHVLGDANAPITFVDYSDFF